MGLSRRYKTALVTGASSGLGAAFADMLLNEGVSVWGTSRNPTEMKPREGFYPVRLELSDPVSIDEAWASIEEISGGIDLLVNNAGSGHFGPFADVSANDWVEQVEIFLLGPVSLARKALAGMVSKGRGCMVFVTSMSVEFPIPFMSGYDAGKAGLSSFADSFGLEVGKSGVSIIDFRPGDFQTKFNQAMNVDKPAIEPDSPAVSTWDRIERLMQVAPGAEIAARDLRRALIRGRSGVVRSGSFFQARMAPILNRLVPEVLSCWARRKYFRLG